MAKSLAAGVALIVATAALSAQAPTFNPADEVSTTGVVRYVIAATSPDGTVGVHLELRTADGPVHVHLASRSSSA